MKKFKLFLAGIFILFLLVGCKNSDWLTPSTVNNTTDNPGSSAWFNNRMSQEQMSEQLNETNLGSQNGGNFQTNVGVQP